MVADRSSSTWSLVARSDVQDDPPQARSLRQALVRHLAAVGDATVPSVIEALRLVPRHLFARRASLLRSYMNRPLLIDAALTLPQPSVVARMTEALDLGGHERVLEIGTGSGYQTAVLSTLAREVFSMEPSEALAVQVVARLERLGYANVRVRVGDGHAGWPDEAPFDRIVVAVATLEIPSVLFPQLAEGGLLVAAVGSADHSRLIRIRKAMGAYLREDLDAASFVGDPDL